MSTFRGIVSEIPQIRVDFFRQIDGQPPPLACFLSHIHSDHLAGLDTLRSPFVYCSAATREILLRLERYPCRMNYTKGLLEARQQTYKHLNKVLKAIQLETPTEIELGLDNRIQVTLFDANHCPGAVMFLIEQNDTAILYTGDLRSEPWFVNYIARHPLLIEYTSGIKRLDKIYLDTSFTDDVHFQTKSEGIAELLRKVAKYPEDTVFYFQTWTYGYEEVWLALSKALKSKIHVDDYKMGIYSSLSTKPSDARFAADSHHTPLAPSLTGYTCGNSRQPGCLTSSENVRLHSCEKGNLCSIASQPNVVKIQPVVAHLDDGTDIVEAGVGGGGNDFQRQAELRYMLPQDVIALFQWVGEENKEAQQWLRPILDALKSGREALLGLGLEMFDDELTASLQSLLFKDDKTGITGDTAKSSDLPRVIRFPYARHSSYEELCHFVDIFKPLDVWPCTENAECWWQNHYSIESYFGEHCSGTNFAYDEMLRTHYPEPYTHEEDKETQISDDQLLISDRLSPPVQAPSQDSQVSLPRRKRNLSDADADDSCRSRTAIAEDSQGSIVSQLIEYDSALRHETYNRVLAGALDGNWEPPSLLSTSDHHSLMEKEL